MGEVLPLLSLLFNFSKLKIQITQISPVIFRYIWARWCPSQCLLLLPQSFGCLQQVIQWKLCSPMDLWFYIILVNHSQHIVSQEPVIQLLDSLHQVKSCFLHFSFMYVFLYMCLLLLLVLEIFNSVSPSPLWFVDSMKRWWGKFT